MDGTDDLAAKLGEKEVIRVQGIHEVEVCNTPLGFSAASQKICNNSMISQKFKFDAVFDETATQEDLFKEVYHLVMSALDGYKV